jgi:hypothetical protein
VAAAGSDIVVHASPIFEDDVFPLHLYYRGAPPLSPTRVHRDAQQRRKSQNFRSSMGCLSNGSSKGLSTSRVEFVIDDPPLHTSTVSKPAPPPTTTGPRLQRQQQAQPQAPPQQHQAQIRPSCLSRRTSFRSQRPGQPPIPVASPKSPLGSTFSYDLKSPAPPAQEVLLDLNKSSKHLQKQQGGAKVFESLKSHTSTASQGSTGSKTSTGSSVTSSSSLSSAAKIAAGLMPPTEEVPSPSQQQQHPMLRAAVSKHILDPSVPDTENPELLAQLQFVSPKQGVYRPVQSGGGSSAATGGKGGKNKQSCSVM